MFTESSATSDGPAVVVRNVGSPPATLHEWIQRDATVREIWKAVCSRSPFTLVSGAAGTGKSTLLRLMARELGHPPILAPTGVAALRVNGQTLHSFFRLPRGVQYVGPDGVSRPTDLYRALTVLIWDEISMARADVIDKINWILQAARASSAPFGGVPIIAFGDLLQLLPVVVSAERSEFSALGYDNPHFFSSRVLDAIGIDMRSLDQVHRQRDEGFVRILHSVRTGDLPQHLLDRLNRRVFREKVALEAGGLILTSRRHVAEELNAIRLAALPEVEWIYQGSVHGRFPRSELPAPIELRIRRGARVMFAKNDPDRRWMNGSLGTVLHCSRDEVVVERETGERCSVRAVEWEHCTHHVDSRTGQVQRRVIGRFVQLPLILGWAATVHKSQGLTLDRVHVNLGAGAFASGQLYVALSRCRSQQGLTLEKPVRRSDLMVDEHAVKFLRSHGLQHAA